MGEQRKTINSLKDRADESVMASLHQRRPKVSVNSNDEDGDVVKLSEFIPQTSTNAYSHVDAHAAGSPNAIIETNQSSRKLHHLVMPMDAKQALYQNIDADDEYFCTDALFTPRNFADQTVMSLDGDDARGRTWMISRHVVDRHGIEGASSLADSHMDKPDADASIVSQRLANFSKLSMGVSSSSSSSLMMREEFALNSSETASGCEADDEQ